MDSLSEEVWDVVISGTSVPQALLALALSRSSKKILHVDRHNYYGGEDAGLSLQDAEVWAKTSGTNSNGLYQDIAINNPKGDEDTQPATALGPSRAYTLSLNPQIIFAQSPFLASLVSSRVQAQLEFLAVSPGWVFVEGKLHRIPSTREDVFNDDSLSMKDKRSLMKFLRFVLQEPQQISDVPDTLPPLSLKDTLDKDFKITPTLQVPLLALTLATGPIHSISSKSAVQNIRRQLHSVGYFGPGFSAVTAKYGGGAEVTQVACRAGAVGGAVYLLGCGLDDVKVAPSVSTNTPENSNSEDSLITSTLSDGTVIRSRIVIGSPGDLPPNVAPSPSKTHDVNVWKSISIVARPLSEMFTPTAENGPIPAVAIVLALSGPVEDPQSLPIYLQIHSEDTGECPSGQCIVYASIATGEAAGKVRLESSVQEFLSGCGAGDSILWTMSYSTTSPQSTETDLGSAAIQLAPGIFCFGPRTHDIAFPDALLSSVKETWVRISAALQDEIDESQFLRFEERETEIED